MNLEEIKTKKIAFVHDWLTGMRGGENVLEQMVEVLGPRDIYTLLSLPENLSPRLNECDLYPSWIQDLPLAKRKHQIYLPLFPRAIEDFDLRSYDLVISTSHCVAKGVVTPFRTFHYSYLHTPVRYAWDFSREYQESLSPRWLVDKIWPWAMHYLRMWDRNSSERVDFYSCNSYNVQRRILKYYNRQSEVLHPPVDSDYFQAVEKKEDYYFLLAALVPYKRVDLALEVCKKMGRKLYIAGGGPELERLRASAVGSSVEVLGRQSSERLRELYQGAKAFLFPGEEDFGITPLEAQACGTPVIAYGRGGALETVLAGETGVFFKEQTVESFQSAIEEFEGKNWDFQKCREQAMKFSNPVFREKFEKSLLSAYRDHREKYQLDLA